MPQPKLVGARPLRDFVCRSLLGRARRLASSPCQHLSGLVPQRPLRHVHLPHQRPQRVEQSRAPAVRQGTAHEGRRDVAQPRVQLLVVADPSPAGHEQERLPERPVRTGHGGRVQQCRHQDQGSHHAARHVEPGVPQTALLTGVWPTCNPEGEPADGFEEPVRVGAGYPPAPRRVAMRRAPSPSESA